MVRLLWFLGASLLPALANLVVQAQTTAPATFVSDTSAAAQPQGLAVAGLDEYLVGNEFYVEQIWHRAITHYSKAIARNPSFPEAHYQRGLAHLRNNDADSAIADLQTALKLRPAFEDAAFRLALVHRDWKQQHERAIELLAGLPSRETNAAVWYEMGGAYKLMKRPKDAEAAYQKCLSLDGTMEQAYCQLGVIYHDAGENDKALEHYGKALRLNPHYGDAALWMSWLLHKLGRVEEAVKAATVAVNARPEHAESVACRAQIYAANGRTAEALRDYDQAIRLEPQNASHRREKADCWVAAPDKRRYPPREGILLATEALRVGPPEFQSYMTFAQAYGNALPAYQDWDRETKLRVWANLQWGLERALELATEDSKARVRALLDTVKTNIDSVRKD